MLPLSPLPALVLAAGPCLAAQDGLELARAHREAHGPAILRELADFLAIPCVASDGPDIRRNAEHLRAMLSARGLEVELLELDDAPPLVVGRLRAPTGAGRPARRTIGIYAHYDGQPVQPEAWRDPPFEPTLYSGSAADGGVRVPFPADGEPVDPEWRLQARAAGDDKAPVVALAAALDALRDAGLAPTSDLLLMLDGEEEAGSPHLDSYLAAHGERLRADFWLICDGPVHQSRRPQLVFGVRGIVGLEITVYGANRSLHSGHYGNWAPNPAMMLAELLASMEDDEGNVLVEGFYDTVEPLGVAERAALEALPEVDEELARELGLRRTEGMEGGAGSIYERVLLPSLNVCGLASAAVGGRSRNVIPDRATAALDVRLVRGNDPEAMLDLVEAHVRAQGYHVVREEPDAETRRAHERIARVVRGTGFPAARTSMTLPFVADVARAVERAAGEPPLRMPTLGGSLPLYLFQRRLGAPFVIVPIANHDDDQHAANENLRLANLWYGIDLFAALLSLP